MRIKIKNFIKEWSFLILIAILAICSTGYFADYYEIDGDCKTIGNLVEIQSPKEDELNKYLDKSTRMILALISNIVPTFSFDRLYSAECKMNQILTEMPKDNV